MPAHDPQREFALEIVQKLRAAGYEALWAGGCVRDELLGLAPKDYDVATSATPDQIRNLFGRRRTLAIGAAFGVVAVLGRRPAGQIEVATFRSDAAYSDGRRPDSVTFTNAEHDAQRRDFTINGLFFDPVANQVVDYVGGQEDLKRHVIRAIGDPRQRLREDKLRMLRAIRFAAAFEFAIDPETLDAIQKMASEVTTVSAERIGMEIRRMLVGPHRAVALRLLRESGLLPQILPELDSLSADSWDSALRRMEQFQTPTLPLALAALVYSVDAATASPYEVPRTTNNSTKSDSDGVVFQIGRRMRFTNKEIDRAHWLIKHCSMIATAPDLPWPTLQRVLTHPGAAELLALREAIAGADDPALAYCRERLAWPPEKLNPPPLVDGSDLISHGLSPSKQFSPLLEKLRDAQLNGEIHSRDEALALAERLLAEWHARPKNGTM